MRYTPTTRGDVIISRDKLISCYNSQSQKLFDVKTSLNALIIRSIDDVEYFRRSTGRSTFTHLNWDRLMQDSVSYLREKVRGKDFGDARHAEDRAELQERVDIEDEDIFIYTASSKMKASIDKASNGDVLINYYYGDRALFLTLPCNGEKHPGIGSAIVNFNYITVPYNVTSNWITVVKYRLTWTRRTHRYYPPAFKFEAKRLMMITLRYNLGRDVTYLILLYLSLLY